VENRGKNEPELLRTIPHLRSVKPEPNRYFKMYEAQVITKTNLR